MTNIEQWEARLQPGDRVQARKHSNDRYYVIPAVVDRITDSLIVVRLDSDVYVRSHLLYRAGRVLALPRYGTELYSGHNGCFPCDGSMSAAVSYVPVTSQ